ncbi:MAG TPA: class I SAM-dependent methyltransferase [Myxococcota bacterium]|nr:class I SAM-dependent methyltransferase [Myxococcota bacterium]
MTAVDPSTLAAGTYARKQIFSRSRLVAWSHGSRFEMAKRLVAGAAGGRLLDYGCGDGTFVAMAHGAFAATVGTDVDAEQLADCSRRFRDLPRLAFVPRAALLEDPGARHAGAYDAVTCMEVLEHCVDEVRRGVLEDLRRLVAPTGRVIISVPIEVGPSLLAKQVARRLAAWRRIGDYAHAERYGWRELARMALPGPGHEIARPTYGDPAAGGACVYHGHKGFDWRTLEAEARLFFDLEPPRYSPMPLLGPLLNSQVWLVGRPR